MDFGDGPSTAGMGIGLAQNSYDPNSNRMAHVPTMAQRLEAAVKQAEERLASAKRARELFNKNPDLEELLNILQRSNF